MARDKTGSIVERKVQKGRRTVTFYYARVTFVEGGNRKQKWRKAESRSNAKEIIKEMLRDLDDHGETLLNAAQMTFNDLADHYEKNYLHAPEYVDGRKVAGLRSYYDLKRRLKLIRSYFGKYKLRGITYGDLKQFKAERLKIPTQAGYYAIVAFKGKRQESKEMRRYARTSDQAEALLRSMVERLSKRKHIVIGEQRVEEKPGSQLSIAAVNRDLAFLRRMFNVALSNGWIKRNPFQMGDALINPGDERKRERILSRDEEARLITACTGKRSHLRPIIICALDTGMRRGEMLKLVPSDLDFENRLILVRAFNTKVMRERQLAMTERLAYELMRLIEQLPPGLDVPLFGITCDFKNAFIAARKVAGLPDLRFHDLRHTHATRLVSAHIPLSEVGRVLGHTQANTTYRYVNATVETARRAAAVLDEFNRSSREPIME